MPPAAKQEIGLASASSLRREPSNDVFVGVDYMGSHGKAAAMRDGEQHTNHDRLKGPLLHKDQDHADASLSTSASTEANHPHRAELKRCVWAAQLEGIIAVKFSRSCHGIMQDRLVWMVL